MVNEYLKFQENIRKQLEQWYTTEEAHSMSHLYIVAENFINNKSEEDTILDVLRSNK